MSAAEADLRAALGAHAPRGRAQTAPQPRGPARRSWAPMTDAEWQALEPLLGAAPCQPRRRGRPPKNLRRTADAVFWVAADAGPWYALPAERGKPGTAHQALRRWARAGLLHRLLLASCRRGAVPGLKSLSFMIARAFRRISRLLPVRALADVRSRRLAVALPAWPLELPTANLSKSTALMARHAVILAREAPAEARGLLAAALAAMRSAQRRLRAWRTS